MRTLQPGGICIWTGRNKPFWTWLCTHCWHMCPLGKSKEGLHLGSQCAPSVCNQIIKLQDCDIRKTKPLMTRLYKLKQSWFLLHCKLKAIRVIHELNGSVVSSWLFNQYNTFHVQWDFGACLEVVWRFALRAFYIGSLRVKLLAYQEVLKWVWPSMYHKRLLVIQSQTLPPGMHQVDINYRHCMQIKQWEIVGDQLSLKSPIELKDNSTVAV